MVEVEKALWVQELRELWSSWLRKSSLAERICSDNCDMLSVITYQLLLPNPEVREINHALWYMLTEILDLHLMEYDANDVGCLADRLQNWRASK